MDRLIAASAFKPRAGSIWSVPKFVLDLLIWFWLFCWTLDGDLRGLVGLEVVLRTRRTEGCFVWWWEGFLTSGRTTRSLASASINIFITLLPAVVWVATCIYFAWSPELARIGFCVVFVFSGWISLFTHTLGPRVSYGAHREGLIWTANEEKPALAPHTYTIFNSAGGDDDEELFIGPDGRKLHDDEERRVDTLAQFRIPRPWDRDAPTIASGSVDELVDLLENVDTIIELGCIRDEDARKTLLTNYLPCKTRNVWRALETYGPGHTYQDFRGEVLRSYPEIAERKRGTLAALQELFTEFNGIRQSEEGRLRRFGLAFQTLVERLQSPITLITNRDACTKYLESLDSGFAQRVQRAVEEREIVRVLLQQLGVAPSIVRDSTHACRKEDLVNLRDLVGIAETISRTDGAYLLEAKNDCLDEGERQRRMAALSRTSLVVNGVPRGGGLSELCRSSKDSDALLDVFVHDAEAEQAEDHDGMFDVEQVGQLIMAVHQLQTAHQRSFEDLRVLYELGDGRSCARVEALREEFSNKLELVQDELRTIQARLRRTQNAEMPRGLSDGAEIFLLNWMKEGMRVQESVVGKREKRVFAPLLSKKQKKLLERAEKQKGKILGNGRKLDEPKDGSLPADQA
ncbi:hypothetical protein GGX14DRAFT_572112 [Mycena pura]|uniref:Uncharacterized protein n=1 Tax=Mycena pura TaxID=153505 RepID=A0AAD6V5J9_9AGAR|nr:hypothetical protein GGX14DRAFT_572112 [Mycena pura]